MKTASVFPHLSYALDFNTGDLIYFYNFRNLQNKDIAPGNTLVFVDSCIYISTELLYRYGSCMTHLKILGLLVVP